MRTVEEILTDISHDLQRLCPVNKPWITNDIKAIINQKKVAFRGGDKEWLKQMQHELKK